MLSENERESLGRVFAEFACVRGVYLFGSHAEETDNPESDLDLGVVLDDGYDRGIQLEMLARLAVHGLERADAVILNEASPLLRHEAVKYHLVLYVRDDFDATAYAERAVMEYLDFYPFYMVQREYLRRDMLGERP